MESVISVAHYVDAAFCLLGQLVVGDENAVALLRPASNASPELVQLAESEALRVEYYHYRRVGNVDPYLNDSSGDEYLCLPLDELVHLGFLFLVLHLSVDFAQAELGKHLQESLIALFEVLEVAFLAFLYYGEDDINLASAVYLVSYALI